MASQHGSGLISRAVREALSTLISPQMCEQVIARSLAAEGLAEIPESGSELGGWLEGSLREEVEMAVGADAADLLVAQLGPIAAYASITKPRTPAPVGNDAANANSAAKPRRSVENLAAAIEAMTSQLPPTAPAFDEDFDDRDFDDARGSPARSPTLRSAPPVGGGFHTPRVEPPNSPGLITPYVSAAGGGHASSARGDSNRPTELRFNLGATPDYSATPHHGTPLQGSSSPFGSEPPTASFARPGAMTLPAPQSNSVPDISVRTLPPPVKQVPPVNDTRPRSARPQRRTAMPERNVSEGHTLPIVLTATSHMDDLAALRRYLAGTATVIHVPDFVGLLDAIDEPGAVEPIVLIDCQRPTVHITSVSAIGEDLPRGTTVVLWGADEHTWQQVDRDRTPGCRWVRCSSEATPHDVGSLCSMLLG